MARDKDWWADKHVKAHPHFIARPDSLVFRFIPDQITAVNALKDELVDVVMQVDAQAFDELKANEFAKTHFNFYTPSTFIYTFVAINNKDIRLNDKRVRRALAHLLDVDLLIQNAYAGYGVPITGLFCLPNRTTIPPFSLLASIWKRPSNYWPMQAGKTPTKMASWIKISMENRSKWIWNI
ncbi:MAG: ABC transporter substrate-binding protein [Saprospiraceae bacterium]